MFVLSLYLLMGALVVQAILSWVNPYNPLAPILDSLTRPYLRPFERLRIGGAVDPAGVAADSANAGGHSAGATGMAAAEPDANVDVILI